MKDQIKILDVTLCKVLKHCQQEDIEVSGLLVGFVDEEGILCITDSITGKQKGDKAAVQLDDSFLIQVASEFGESSRETIVGWYHSHPGLGLFMSATDVATQERFQALFPKAVALVVDPIAIKLKFYRLFAHDKKWKSVNYKILEPSLLKGAISQ